MPANCDACGKRILFWNLDAKLCMDCFKKRAKGNRVKWLAGFRK